MAMKGRMPTMIHKQTTAMSMMTTPNTTNTNTNAPVAAVDDCDCCTAYATSADLCAQYITLDEARKERPEKERNEQRRAEWGDRLENKALRQPPRAQARARCREGGDGRGGQGGGEARVPHEPFGDVVRAGARSGCEAADAAGHRVPGRRARARAAARFGAARSTLEEVPPKGDSRVLCDAAVPAPLGGG